MTIADAIVAFVLESKNTGLVESVVVCVCVEKGGATHMTTLEDLLYCEDRNTYQ